MGVYFDNRIIKKILFQYINKCSYNVSLLEIVLRRNKVLKFALSLVSKALLFKRGMLGHYSEKVDWHVELRVCADEFGVGGQVKIRDSFVETEGFFL